MRKHLKITGFCFCHHLGGKWEQYERIVACNIDSVTCTSLLLMIGLKKCFFFEVIFFSFALSLQEGHLKSMRYRGSKTVRLRTGENT